MTSLIQSRVLAGPSFSLIRLNPRMSQNRIVVAEDAPLLVVDHLELELGRHGKPPRSDYVARGAPSCG
jgi:hypothetical protein